GLPPVRMRVSNRNLSEGFYRGLGVNEPAAVLQRVDKLDKLGAEQVTRLLTEECGLSPEAAGKVIELASVRSDDDSFVDEVRALGVRHEQLDEGLELLAEVVRSAGQYRPGRLVVDLSIARGLDYYTGTVYETSLVGYESMGSISSGGRYDSLASDGRTTYPGVGISLGVSRLLVPLLAKGRLVASRPVPTAVLVAVTDEDSRAEAVAVASALRARGVPTEVAPSADRFGKQIRYADRRQIPYVWFGGRSGEVKDIRSGEQVPADADQWSPPEADLKVTVQGRWGEPEAGDRS
ncbi:MAG: ATP phosphoribosyltransferase regulatory subunit, partial [Actinomycetia bacterium]|nr:ATP phosphoribosyltransferase regulatory subunit [Actinomycetes bacterium]